MNKQGPKGIEYVDYTWNPVAGCLHACRWQMPDGTWAECYAKTTAEGLARAAYPHGFAHHYWHPDRLDEPYSLQQPSRIFLDSMSDLMGHWVPDEQIRQVLAVVKAARQHTFLLLTKNPIRLASFWECYPPNLHIGVSMPPSAMWGRALTWQQQLRLFTRGLLSLAELPRRHPLVLWLSLEPLSFDAARLLRHPQWHPDWLVIGAASNGRVKVQPDPAWVQGVLDYADARGIPVFMKGNLAWDPHREELP